MSDFKAKIHQIRFRLGLCPKPCWGSVQRSTRPPSWREGVGLAASHRKPQTPLSIRESGLELRPFGPQHRCSHAFFFFNLGISDSAVQCREFYAPIWEIVSSVQFLVTRSIVMQCEHLGKLIVFFVATYSWYFFTAQTALYHCTIASYHCTFCVSLHSILCPEYDRRRDRNINVASGFVTGNGGSISSLKPTFLLSWCRIMWIQHHHHPHSCARICSVIYDVMTRSASASEKSERQMPHALTLYHGHIKTAELRIIIQQ